MSTVRWEDVKRRVYEERIAAGLPVPTDEERQAAKEKLLAEVRAYQLAEVRREHALTQKTIAETMGVSIPRVSALEHGEIDQTGVATLRRYVEALGGKLRVVAKFDDVEYTIS